MLLASRPLPLEEARRTLIKVLQDSGLSLEELVSGLALERERLAGKRYGKGG